MRTLAELKKALVDLPVRQRRADAGNLYSAHVKKLQKARERISEVLNSADWAGLALPSGAYAFASEMARRACKFSAPIQDQLKADPGSIRGLEGKLTNLYETAERAHESFMEAWQRAVEAKVEGNKNLVSFICTQLPTQGRALSVALSTLRNDQRKPPASEADATRVREVIEKIDSLTKEIGLEGPFGKFLSAAANAGEGADPKLLLDPAVQAELNRHGLWKCFRVRMA